MKFQLVKEHPKTFEIRHPEGHSFHVAKDALSPNMIKSFKAMPAIKMAEGGEVEGNEEESYSAMEPEETPDTDTQVPGKQEEPDQKEQAESPSVADTLAKSIQGLSEPGAGQTQPNVAAQPRVFNVPTTNAPTEGSAQAPAVPVKQPLGLPEQLKQNLGMEEAGIKQQAGAESIQAQKTAEAFKEMNEGIKSARNKFNENFGKIPAENQALSDDIKNSNIDPNHYWSSMDTAGKIGTSISLLLGGIGAGLAGGQNLALKTMNDAIARDIEAQKANLGKKESLLSLNMKRYGDGQQALLATEANLRAVAEGQIARAAAEVGTPMADARAKIAIAQLRTQNLGVQSKLAMDQAGLSMLNQMQGKPGAAMAGTPEQIREADNQQNSLKVRFLVPDKQQESAYKELAVSQAMTKGQEDLNDVFDKMSNINTVSNRLTSPIQSTKQLHALSEPVLAKLAKDSEGRVTPQDVDALRPLLPEMGDSADTLLLKKRKMNEYITEKMNFPLLKAYGIETKSLLTQSGKKKIDERKKD